MKKRLPLILTFIVIFVQLTSCAKQQIRSTQIKQEEKSEPSDRSNPVAMNFVMRAAIAESSGDFWQAIALYKTALDFEPQSLTILQALSELYFRVEEPSPARVNIMKALKIAPMDEKNWNLFIKIAILQRDRQSIQSMVSRWSANTDLSEKQYTLLSDYYALIGDFGKSTEMIEYSGKKFGWNIEKLETLASLKITQRKNAEAIQTYQKMIELYPNESKSYFILGNLFLLERDTISALGLLEQFQKLEPNDVRGCLILIDLYSMIRKQSQSDSLLQQALVQFPDNVQILSLDIRRLIRMKDYRNSIHQAQKIIEIHPNEIQAYVDIGFMYHELQEYHNAESIYIKALEIDSTNSLLLNNYAYLLATQKKDLDKALKMVTQALEDDEQNLSYIDTKAWILYQMELYEDALQTILQIINRDLSLQQNEVSSEVWDHYGDILYALGKIEEAKEAWRHAVSLDPENKSISAKLE